VSSVTLPQLQKNKRPVVWRWLRRFLKPLEMFFVWFSFRTSIFTPLVIFVWFMPVGWCIASTGIISHSVFVFNWAAWSWMAWCVIPLFKIWQHTNVKYFWITTSAKNIQKWYHATLSSLVRNPVLVQLLFSNIYTYQFLFLAKF